MCKITISYRDSDIPTYDTKHRLSCLPTGVWITRADKIKIEWNRTELYFFFYFCSMFVTSCKRLRIMKGSEARGVWETKLLRKVKCFWCDGRKKTNNLSACVIGRTNVKDFWITVEYAMPSAQHTYLKLCSKEGKWKIQCSFLVSWSKINFWL
jgi:hypothetical protein